MQFALVSRDILFLNFNINAFGEHIIHLKMLSQPNIALALGCQRFKLDDGFLYPNCQSV